MQRCKCKASNVEARRKMEAEQREMKPTAVIMNRAKERWRTCLDWFDLLWGAKHSPYLGPEDRGAYKDLLAALLKQPAEDVEGRDRVDDERHPERRGGGPQPGHIDPRAGAVLYVAHGDGARCRRLQHARR